MRQAVLYGSRAAETLASARRDRLQRLFSTFPGGWPGVGLLLLRAAVGATAVAQGFTYLALGGNPRLAALVVGSVAIAGGAAVLIGLMTPVACVLAGLGCACIEVVRVQTVTPHSFDAGLATVFLITMAAAVVLLGPGAFSVDARLFGRREIVIAQTPQSPHSSQSSRP